MAGSPDSHDQLSDRLNFLNVRKRSSSRRSNVSGCRPKHNGPAAVGRGRPLRVNSTPANTRISFCLASVKRLKPPDFSSVMTNG